jgi:hypothetical protein
VGGGMELTATLFVFTVCCCMMVLNMLSCMVMGFRVRENHIMGNFIICACHVVVIKLRSWISETYSVHGEMVTLHTARWCRSVTAV